MTNALWKLHNLCVPSNLFSLNTPFTPVFFQTLVYISVFRSPHRTISTTRWEMLPAVTTTNNRKAAMDTPCRASTEYACPTDAIRSSGTERMTRPASTLTFNMRENRRIHREAAVDTEDLEDMAVPPVHTFRPGTSSVDAFLPNLNALQCFVYTEDKKKKHFVQTGIRSDTRALSYGR